jgi:NADP-dependent 3-hydroxy acid dehydrogenase YdfG
MSWGRPLFPWGSEGPCPAVHERRQGIPRQSGGGDVPCSEELPAWAPAEPGCHNSGAVREEIDSFYATTAVLTPEDIADGVAYIVTRPRHASIGALWIMHNDQA